MENTNNTLIDQLCIDNIRVLCAEMIDKANSGHPGMAMGSAPILHVLFTKFLNASVKNPNWFNRDYFILSSGHASSLLYTMLHLCGYKLSMEDLKGFRSLGSITPGHPEVGVTPGVDASTGPLGQGVAEAVGVAIAESHLRIKSNNLINHYTYCLCGDGDLQEGVCQEAMSLAGNLGLERLIVLYDSNDIQLDGPVNKCNTENVKKKYEAMGWKHILVNDGNNCKEIENAIKKAKKQTMPTIIEVKTIIGYGTSNAGTNKAHGTPLPHDEVIALRKNLGTESFTIPEEVYEYYKKTFTNRGNRLANKWKKLYKKLATDDIKQIVEGNNDFDYDEVMPKYDFNYNKATRQSGGEILSAIAKINPQIIGGAADLTSSTKTKGADGDFNIENRLGREIKYGVREHAMGAISNGLALHKMRPFCSTFFAFVDYLKPTIRLAALTHLPTVFIFTHDSIAVGEDGPTHHPVEQLTMVRSIPNVDVIRPCDANEAKQAYKIAFTKTDSPTVIVLSRQGLQTVVSYEDSQVNKGAYILSDSVKEIPDGILIASGSEVKLALDTKEVLKEKGLDIRVVSMPSTNLFDKQSKEYKEEILPRCVTKKLAIEMSDATHYYKYVGLDGLVYNIEKFGTSAPSKEVIEKYGFTKEQVAKAFLEL